MYTLDAAKATLETTVYVFVRVAATPSQKHQAIPFQNLETTSVTSWMGTTLGITRVQLFSADDFNHRDGVT